LPIALDATYSAGTQLTGVGVYCREIMHGLSSSHPEERFRWLYRPHRYLRSWRDTIPQNCSRRILLDQIPSSVALFHGLNQRLPKWRPKRSVTTFHDLFVMTGEYSTPEFRERFTKLAREAASNSDLIITVSQFTATQVHHLLNVDRSRLRVVHHGVRLPSIRNTSREPIVLHVGAIQKRKNIARLIEAFRSLPQQWRLILAGSAGYGCEEMLSVAGERVQVTGYVTDEQLAQLYQRASIFAFPSLDEGFGMPVLEAMAHGIPVIASNSSALPEVCGDAALLVDPVRTDQIAAELLRLATEPNLRNDFSTRGLARASQFSWTAAVEKTWGVYRELLD
jgi:glycosyltransferase involved in cell wall biosynthesis